MSWATQWAVHGCPTRAKVSKVFFFFRGTLFLRKLVSKVPLMASSAFLPYFSLLVSWSPFASGWVCLSYHARATSLLQLLCCNHCPIMQCTAPCILEALLRHALAVVQCMLHCVGTKCTHLTLHFLAVHCCALAVILRVQSSVLNWVVGVCCSTILAQDTAYCTQLPLPVLFAMLL